MKSFRQNIRLLEAARRDARAGFREYFRAPNGDRILCESESEYEWWSQFCGGLQEKHLKPEDFSVRDIFEHSIPDGRSLHDAWRHGDGVSLLEAAGAVSTSQFSSITGQILYTKVLEGFMLPQFVFSAIIPDVQTQFTGERIPGMAGMGDQNEVVGEGQPYPDMGLSEDYIDLPQTLKRGGKISVTKEAVFFDRTSLLLKRAGEVGEYLGLNKEKRAIDCIVDENTTAHRFKGKWTNDAAIATYGDASGTHYFDNLAASNALVDWTDLNAVEQLFAALTDIYTGEPIEVMADTLIVCPELVHNARFALNATMVALQAGGFATTGNLYQTQSPNPIGAGSPFSGSYNIVTSRLLPARLATNTSWFLGNPRRAFQYSVNWPLKTETAPPNSAAEFERDVVAQYKASERGAYATIDPRYMAKSTA